MDEHLNKLTLAIQDYEVGSYLTKDSLRELLRTISSEIYFLTQYQVKAKNDFNSFMYHWKGAVSKGEIRAHEEHPELYLLRHIIKSAQNVLQSIIMEISILNKES